MARYLPLARMLPLRPNNTLLWHHHSGLASYYSTCCKPSTTQSSTTSLPILRVLGDTRTTCRRHIAEWHTRRDSRGFSQRESVVVCVSVGVFLLYFLWLREPSDIDEYMSQPIWKRLPGIDPEKAERMMEVDRSLGLQVDHTELEKYKQEYYAQQVEKLNQEKQQRKRHQELLQAASTNSAMFTKVNRPPVDSTE